MGELELMVLETAVTVVAVDEVFTVSAASALVMLPPVLLTTTA
jgi:hypothetical protein